MTPQDLIYLSVIALLATLLRIVVNQNRWLRHEQSKAAEICNEKQQTIKAEEHATNVAWRFYEKAKKKHKHYKKVVKVANRG